MPSGSARIASARKGHHMKQFSIIDPITQRPFRGTFQELLERRERAQ
jgi:hypothetical protein